MQWKRFAALAASLLALTPFETFLAAQTATRTQEQLKALLETHKSDFDYLLGDWEFTAVNRQYGAMRGYWSAVRLAEGGQILDEYRIVGDKGETYYSTTTLRAYNAARDQWELISMDQGSGLQNFGTGHREGGEMLIEQKFGVTSPNPSLWRIRYHDIQPDRFLWNADRSADAGKTWDKDFQKIEAHRIGPSRSIGPLAPARNSANPGPNK